MEDLKTDEEFYAFISQKLEEVYSLKDVNLNPVPMETKRSLQYMVYQIMWNYIEGKNRNQETERNFRKFGEGLSQLENSLYSLKENMIQLYDTTKIALINAKIAAAKMREASENIKKTKQEVSEKVRGLLHELDAKDALLSITIGMTSQKKEN
jgi:hypothetical protein